LKSRGDSRSGNAQDESRGDVLCGIDGTFTRVVAEPGTDYNENRVLIVVESTPPGGGRAASVSATGRAQTPLEEFTLFSAWIIALTVGATAGEIASPGGIGPALARRAAHEVCLLQRPGSRLADIGPAPRTVLTDSRNEPFDLEKLRGKVVLVSFVYTTCNGVCPLTTQTLVGVRKKLEAAKLWGKSVEFVSITLDPERDTAPVLKNYAKLSGADFPAWHFLTGAPADVGKVIEAWDMWVKSDAKGVIDHPSRIFLIDGHGHQREIYNLEFLKPETVLDDVRGLLGD
jgi:protein SCO1